MKKGANILIFNMIRHEEQSCYTNQTQKVTWEPSGSIARQQATLTAEGLLWQLLVACFAHPPKPQKSQRLPDSSGADCTPYPISAFLDYRTVVTKPFL
ncbi:hypothetical protein J1N35_001735 [Gossypium stocksii]|uniref:Uncharacterized protein n=1 Tax=Gossypium stocksii TaxID=47602 RepID=A0A9D3WJP4_9ROSI|nr:hypothetical protein J1N35_001735 [Gossypium stocksii]